MSPRESTPRSPSEVDTASPSLFTIARREVATEDGKILALGWPVELTEIEVPHSVFLSGLAGATESQSTYAAAIWRLPKPQADGPHSLAVPSQAKTVRALRSVLLPSAILVVLVPATPGVNIRGPLGLLPSGYQELLRSTVSTLSENGFSIRKERHLTEGASKTTAFHGQSEGWHLLVARPDPFSIRSYCPGDEEAILHLFPRCFFVDRGLEHWRWKYAENPWGKLCISVALAPNGDLAAHYAGYGMPFWYQENGGTPRTLTALQMGDTMTHPDYRNNGRGKNSLLARSVRHFFALHRGGSYGFFYGFNTGPIQRFCNWFIGGSRVEPVGFWKHHGEPPAAKSRGYRIEQIHHIESSFDHLFRRTAPHYRFMVQRDAHYVDWRYLRCPDTQFVVLTAKRWGRLVAWCVFRRQENRLLWGDALFRPRHTRAAASLLRAALILPQHAGIEQVEAWFPERPSWWSQTVEDLGFHREPHPDGLALMALPDNEETVVEKLQDLYYTMGDGDLF